MTNHMTIRRSPRRDSIRKREAIMVATRRLFLDKGYSASSMDEVAELANVSKRTVYSHFGNKQNLFFAMIGEMCSNVIPRQLVEAGNNNGGDVEARLTEIGTAFLSNIYTPDQVRLMRQVMAEAASTPEMGRMMIEGPIKASHGAIRDFLADMTRQGSLDIADADVAAAQFQGLLKTDLHMFLLLGRDCDTSPARLRKIVERCVGLFLKGYARS